VGQIEPYGVILFTDDFIAFMGIIFYILPSQVHETIVPAVKSGIMGIQVVPDDVMAHDKDGPIFLDIRRCVNHYGSLTLSIRDVGVYWQRRLLR
jgi:hypothetical protein